MKEKPIMLVDNVDIITPLSLKGKHGKFSIETNIVRRGNKVTIVNMRNAIYSGLKPQSIVISDWDITVHKLLHHGDLVTSDCPNEIYTQWKNGFDQAYGRVLVGGLGIGMASCIIANAIKGVSSVTTVEIDQDDIALIKPQLPKFQVPHHIVRADLFKYIKTSSEKGHSFDSAYFDIWSGTGESSWSSYIVPLRRLMAKYHPDAKVTNWLEGDMVGQIRLSLNQIITGSQFSIFGHEVPPLPDPHTGKVPTRTEMREGMRGWIRVFRPLHVFGQAIKDSKDQRASKDLAIIYTDFVGSPEWERIFGKLWDSWKKPTEKERKAIYKSA